jgi:hypothetical protein
MSFIVASKKILSPGFVDKYVLMCCFYWVQGRGKKKCRMENHVEFNVFLI